MSALPPKADISRHRWHVRLVPVPDSVRTLFHQHGVEFGKYGRQLGLIGEAVQPGNEAIKPWRQENQIAARLRLPITVRRTGGEEHPGSCRGVNHPAPQSAPPWTLSNVPSVISPPAKMHIGGCS